MGIEAAGGHYQNGDNPIQGVQNALNNWRERRAQFHQNMFLQNQNHAFQAEENAKAHQRHIESLRFQGGVQAVLNDQAHNNTMRQMDKKYGQEKGLAIQAHGFATQRADQDAAHNVSRIRTQGSVDRSMERLKHKNAFGNRPSQFDALMEASKNPNVGNLNIGGASLTTRTPGSGSAPASTTPASGSPKPKRARRSAPPQP